jgi:GT2 family glycosyltransferase/O-antigen ligase
LDSGATTPREAETPGPAMGAVALLMRHRKLLLAIASLAAFMAIATLVAPADVLRSLERFTKAGVAMVFCAVLLSVTLAFLRFRVALASYGGTPPWSLLLTAFAAGQVSNSFLFNVIGQSLSRGAVLSTAGVPFGVGVIATYTERLIATAMLLALALAAALILFVELRPEINLQGAQLLLTAVGVLCVLVALRIGVPVAFQGLQWRWVLASALRQWRIMLLAGAGHLLMLAAYAVLLFDLQPTRISIEVVAALVIVMFAASLPISFAGWGLRELSSAHALAAVGVPVADAVAVAIAIGLVSTATLVALGGIAAIGGSALLRKRRIDQTARAESQPDEVTGRVWQLCVVFAAAMVFFQVRVPISSGELTLNLGDLFAMTGAALALFLGWRERALRNGVLFAALGLVTAALVFALLRGWLVFGSNHWATTNRGIGWIVIVSYAVLGASAAQGSPAFRALVARTLVVAGTTVAAVQILLFVVAVFGVRPVDYGFFLPLRGFAQNANAFTVQMIVTIIAALALRWQSQDSAVSLLPFALCGAAIFLSSSRTGYAMLAMLCIVLALHRARGDLPAAGAIVAGICGALLLPRAIGLLLTLLGSDGAGAAAEIRMAHASSDSERWQTLLDGLELWRANPWLGAGLGGYVQLRIAAQLDFQVIHSVPIWLLAEFGMLGTAVVGLAFVKLLLETYRLIRAADTRAWGLAALVLLLAMGAAFLVHDFFYQRIIWLMLGLAIGAAPPAVLARRAGDFVVVGPDAPLAPAAALAMPRAPRVAIVVPFFNSHATLPQTLASLDAQSFRDFEVVIVNDGSTDPAATALLQDLPPRFRVLNQPNRGLPAARNAGVAAVRSELILPLDSDDLLEPEALAKLVAALDADPDADLAFSWTRRFGDESGISPMAFNPFEQLFVNEAPYCMLMRRALIARAGGYDERMRLGYEDWEFNIRLNALGARAVVIPEPLFLYRIRSGSMLRATTMTRHVEIWREIRRRHGALYGPRGLVDAWRRGRRERAIWPLPALALWGGILAMCPPGLINPAYRSALAITRGLRDRWKSQQHGST